MHTPGKREVSGTDLKINNRGSVPRISPCQGRSVLILVQMMNIIMLVQVVGLYIELYTAANYVVWERIVSEGGGGIFLDKARCITGDHLRNGSGQQWGVYLGNG